MLNIYVFKHNFSNFAKQKIVLGISSANQRMNPVKFFRIINLPINDMSLSGPIDFKPKLISAMKDYSFSRFKTDLIAGIVVGIVALPLAVAFAIASGVSPTIGLVTAIIGGFLVSALGGCSVQIGGPTGAFIIIIYGIIENFGLEGLAVATFMAGLILVLMGLFHLGTVIKFIPYPIVVGFTSGIALTIFSTQMNDFFSYS